MLTRNSYLANAILGGTPGLIIACLLYAAMSWCSYTLLPSTPPEENFGLCLPSPNLWVMPAWLSLSLAVALAGVCVIISVALNARFSLIPGTGLLYATLFLVSAGSVPWLTQRLSSAIILLTATLACTYLLFSLYGRKNASQGIFLIFSILGWGAMIQYSFLLLIPIFMLGALFLRVFRFKGLIASIMGIIAPYWILYGLGVITPDDFQLPTLTNMLTDFAAPDTLFFLMAGQGFSSLLLLILTASNSMSASATGQQYRSYISFLNLLGIAMVWFMLFDYVNMMAYIGVTAICLGFQCARYAAIPRHKFAYLPILIAIPVFIALYILTLTY